MLNLAQFRQQIDEMRRQTAPQWTALHALLDGATQACIDIEFLQLQLGQAWEDAAGMARREFANSAMQAVATMVGVKRGADGKLTPALDDNDGSTQGTEKAVSKVAELAWTYAKAMAKEESEARKGKVG